MKFRTEIEVAPLARKIDHRTCVLSAGSCFAGSIAAKLRRYKFRVTGNPTGVLYNPFSIADALEGMGEPELSAADIVLVTFGTAWVYELDGRVVANCGKRPAHLFTRRRLTVEEIVRRFDGLLGGSADEADKAADGTSRGVLQGRQVIFTVSPVRHLKDGFEENSLSKATLRLAIAGIIERHENTHYFPAYEIVNDDLRDYRFYGADLVHPSPEAIEYVWEKFAGAAFSAETGKLLPQIENIVRATEHRPFDPDTGEHAGFRRQMFEQVRELVQKHPGLDMSAEIEFFS